MHITTCFAITTESTKVASVAAALKKGGGGGQRAAAAAMQEPTLHATVKSLGGAAAVTTPHTTPAAVQRGSSSGSCVWFVCARAHNLAPPVQTQRLHDLLMLQVCLLAIADVCVCACM